MRNGKLEAKRQRWDDGGRGGWVPFWRFVLWSMRRSRGAA